MVEITVPNTVPNTVWKTLKGTGKAAIGGLKVFSSLPEKIGDWVIAPLMGWFLVDNFMFPDIELTAEPLRFLGGHMIAFGAAYLAFKFARSFKTFTRVKKD